MNDVEIVSSVFGGSLFQGTRAIPYGSFKVPLWLSALATPVYSAPLVSAIAPENCLCLRSSISFFFQSASHCDFFCAAAPNSFSLNCREGCDDSGPVVGAV